MAQSQSIAFHAELTQMVRELGVSHFSVVPPEALSQARTNASERTGGLGIDVRAIDATPVITRVEPGSAAEQAGIKPGFILERVDELAVDAGNLGAAQTAMLGSVGSEARLTFRSGDGSVRTKTLKRSPRSGEFYSMKVLGVTVKSVPPQYGELEAKRIQDNVGYLRFTRFIPALVPRLKEAIGSMAGAPGLIIDLRGNPGGEDEVGVALANLLVEKKSVFMITRKRSGAHTYAVHPQGRRFKGPLVILLDGISASASEQFAAGMQELGRAVVVGERSAGRDLDATIMRLPSGGVFQYAYGEPRTPKGVVIEGRGVIPDVEVGLKRADLLRGVDTQVEAAVRAVKSATPRQS